MDEFTAASAKAANANTCDYKNGTLPRCAALAAAYTPLQQENAPKYGSNEALTRGTLFPGLDLPFMNIANKNNPYAGTPLGEIMAIDFVIKELTLYLDTHKNDKEAFKMLQEMLELSKKGREQFAKKYGPIQISDLTLSDKYNWLDNPWPWDFDERTGN